MKPNALKVDREAIKTLVVAYGQREAARRAGINANTVRSWAKRYGWKQAHISIKKTQPIRNQSPADALYNVIQSHKERSTTALARYAAEASEQAAEAENKVQIAPKVRDIAAVHSSLWPEANEQRGILSLNVLIGNYCPPDSAP